MRLKLKVVMLGRVIFLLLLLLHGADSALARSDSGRKPVQSRSPVQPRSIDQTRSNGRLDHQIVLLRSGTLAELDRVLQQLYNRPSSAAARYIYGMLASSESEQLWRGLYATTVLKLATADVRHLIFRALHHKQHRIRIQAIDVLRECAVPLSPRMKRMLLKNTGITLRAVVRLFVSRRASSSLAFGLRHEKVLKDRRLLIRGLGKLAPQSAKARRVLTQTMRRGRPQDCLIAAETYQTYRPRKSYKYLKLLIKNRKAALEIRRRALDVLAHNAWPAARRFLEAVHHRGPVSLRQAAANALADRRAIQLQNMPGASDHPVY